MTIEDAVAGKENTVLPSVDPSNFLKEASGLLGQDRVLPSETAEPRYGANTIGVRRKIAGAVLAHTTDEVADLVRLAKQYRVPLYPMSTGHNWGYGSANPVADGCVVVDLSAMKDLTVDADLGTVRLQAGVTQGLLKSYLDKHHPEFLVPVHGGGPDCSLLGNALERGYGITPLADHFGAVMELTAVLPTGELYRGSLSAAGAPRIDAVFKWGVGPYLDGLFSQGNFGIVTEMVLALARKPRRIEAFYFWVQNDAQLELAVEQVREVLRSFNGLVGSVNLMNDRRLLSMTVPYPKEAVPPGQIMSAELVRDLCRQQDVPAWGGIGALYGDDRVVRAARAGIKKALKPVSQRLIFMTMARCEGIGSCCPFCLGALSAA